MKISTKGRYALRVMIDLAMNSNGKYISLKDIAERQEISNKYLELNKEYYLGNYRGFELTITNKGIKDLFQNHGEPQKIIKIKGNNEYSFDLLKVPSLNIKKIDEKIDSIENNLNKI